MRKYVITGAPAGKTTIIEHLKKDTIKKRFQEK